MAGAVSIDVAFRHELLSCRWLGDERVSQEPALVGGEQNVMSVIYQDASLILRRSRLRSVACNSVLLGEDAIRANLNWPSMRFLGEI